MRFRHLTFHLFIWRCTHTGTSAIHFTSPLSQEFGDDGKVLFTEISSHPRLTVDWQIVVYWETGHIVRDLQKLALWFACAGTLQVCRSIMPPSAAMPYLNSTKYQHNHPITGSNELLIQFMIYILHYHDICNTMLCNSFIIENTA